MKSAPAIRGVFENERSGGSERLTVSYVNWGDPYDEGARFDLHSDLADVTVDLTRREVVRLHDFLGQLLTKMP